jgi:tetratricopeptide (TPR) repeat protein
VVLLSGEPGIGKSRLTAALLERLATEPHTRLRYFCSPQRTDSAFFPIISQMERAAGFIHDDTVQAKLDKLDALMAQNLTSRQDMALFAEMLSLPNDGRYPTLDLTPQQRRQKTLEALRGTVETFALKNPVLMIFEDAQWADPTSLEVFSGAVDRTPARRALLIITFRPEFDPPWLGRACVTALNLNRLGERETAALIDRVTGNKSLPPSITQDIIERTDGIPLFVEEMTRAVLEAESEGDASRTAAAVPSSALAVPASLHASLMARLDRLGPAKEVAQIGAVIGREFSHALLAAVVRKPEAELNSALDRLIQSGLLFRQGVPPHASYLFKHALVQDAAYGTLLREPRRALHALIAATLETDFAAVAENQPEVLARHCGEAGLIEKAAGLWGMAGQRSLERSAFLEATALLTRALEQISTLSTTPPLRRQQIKFQSALAAALINSKGPASPEATAAVEQARFLIERADALGERSDHPLQLFRVLDSLWSASYTACNGDAMRERAAQYLALAEKQGAIIPLIVGRRLMGTSLMWTGDVAEGRVHFDHAIALYDHAERPLATRVGKDYWVYTLTDRSIALWTLGYPDAALADAERVIKDARDFGRSLAYAASLTSRAWTLCGNYATAIAQLDEAIAWADEKGSVFWRALLTGYKGWVFALTGEASDAVQMITSAIAAWRSTGSIAAMTTWLPCLAIAYADLGQFDNAWRCIEEAMATIKITKEKIFEAEVNRIAGEIALKSPGGNASKAEMYFERAIVLARQQQAKSWELRAAMSSARLWRDQGKPRQARELLAPVYGWFSEGFDTRDLKEAKALLEELAA